MSQGAGRASRPSEGMPSLPGDAVRAPRRAGCEEWGACPGPAGQCRLSWPPSKRGLPQGSLLRRPDRGWCARGGRAGKPPPCCSASSLPFPPVDFRRSGLDAEDARVTCGYHVQMSIGTCPAPGSRVCHQPSRATSARAVGSSTPVPSPETWDSVSPPSACSCLGQYGLHLHASAVSLPVPL